MDIRGERKQNGLLLRSPQLFAENARVERVDELEFGEVCCEERRFNALHDCRGSGRVGIGNVEREEEAGIRAGDQKRSRSAANCWAPETLRRFLPKVFFWRPRKPGKTAGGAGGRGGKRGTTRVRGLLWRSSRSAGRTPSK